MTLIEALKVTRSWHRLGVLLTLAKTNLAASEVYLGGVVDGPLSGWLAGRLREAGLAT